MEFCWKKEIKREKVCVRRDERKKCEVEGVGKTYVCVCVYRNGKGLILKNLHFSNYKFEKGMNCS